MAEVYVDRKMLSLDDLDVRILKEFGSPSSPQWNVRESYAKVADRIGVDEETIRKRVIRMKEAGSLPKWLMKPNPYLLGRQGAGVDLEVPQEDKKSEAIAKIKSVEGVVTILDFLGKGISVVIYFEDDAALDRMADEIGSICGSKPVVVKQAFSRPEVAMKRVDWEIIDVMADDARMDLQDVADRTKATVRTIQRRLAKMIEGKAVYLSGRPIYGKMTGLSCNFLVFCPETTKKQTMDREVLSKVKRLERSDTASKEYSMFTINCENPKEADESLAWLKGFDGVEWVRIGIIKEAIHVQDWLKKEIRKRAST
jgi:DNA-binding Lrp family transcriptional regulator